MAGSGDLARCSTQEEQHRSGQPPSGKVYEEFGLYERAREKDACGVGFIANVRKEASRAIVSDATKLLMRMTHRGAKQGEDGDGAGLMVAMPHSFFECLADMGHIARLPPPGSYGVAMMFLPTDALRRAELMEEFEMEAARHGLSVFCWRAPLPTKSFCLGPRARQSEPFIVQAFICKQEDARLSSCDDSDSENSPSRDEDFNLDMPTTKTTATRYAGLPSDLEALLFLLRKSIARFRDVYVCSMSSRLLVYKGLFESEQLFHYYDDLLDERFTSYLALVHARYSTNTSPSWSRAHPFRRICHNGEINTIQGNRKWLRAREGIISKIPAFGDLPVSHYLPVEEPAPLIAADPSPAPPPSGSGRIRLHRGEKRSRRLSIDSSGIGIQGGPAGAGGGGGAYASAESIAGTENSLENLASAGGGGHSAESTTAIEESPSDSAILDNVVEMLNLAGRDLAHAVMMLMPEAIARPEKPRSDEVAGGVEQDEDDDDEVVDEAQGHRDFFDFHSTMAEPWDGPALVCFTDGKQLGAALDRNGLRPGRVIVTTDDRVILASETGVVDVPADKVLYKSRLRPGRVLLIDFEREVVMDDREVKNYYSAAEPYGKWLKSLVHLDDVSMVMNEEDLRRELRVPGGDSNDKFYPSGKELKTLATFGFTAEKFDMLVAHMAKRAADPLGSMGNDTPLACLSELPQLPSDYFCQIFAEATNPAIDPIREANVMSLETTIGPEGDFFQSGPGHCQRIFLKFPLLTPFEFRALRTLPRFPSQVIDITWARGAGPFGLLPRLKEVVAEAASAVREGVKIIVLSDSAVSEDRVPIFSSLAVGAVHEHLIREKLRLSTAIVAKVGSEAFEVHQLCFLLSSGADAIYPYAVYRSLHRTKFLTNDLPLTLVQLMDNYRNAAHHGVLKVMSKMGICTLRSYKGSGMMQAVGVSEEVLNFCFGGCTSPIGGVGFDTFSLDAFRLHAVGFDTRVARPLVDEDSLELPDSGEYHFRGVQHAEAHMNHPETIAAVQEATKNGGNVKSFTAYEDAQNALSERCELRGQLEFAFDKCKPVPMDEVEPASEIVKRFATGAMSFGALSEEAHSTLAIAMNRIGGRSNTGEGGESDERYIPLPNGDSARSAIKQVASGRFGVTAAYLVNADEIQIKLAQGAKPGEGGELPGYKVQGKIATTRRSTPGVGLISPPPHHDMYSIEDVAQLIYDLKNVNPAADVSVKLVTKYGVGIVAAGIAKALADRIVVSAGSGGTAAAKWTSIKHAGMPWELGIAETHQTLCVNGLRERVALQVDGQMRTARDVMVATLLGAEEYGFATVPLIVLGCIMMRKCHLNTCPVGICTQDEELRRKFDGKPEHVVNFFFLCAEGVRRYLAELGFRNLNDAVGRSDLLRPKPENRNHSKKKKLDFAKLLTPGWQATGLGTAVGVSCCTPQPNELDRIIDKEIVRRCRNALLAKIKTKIEMPIRNVDRSVGALLTYHIIRLHGSAGLPKGTISVKFHGSGGQSFGTMLCGGVAMELIGDTNDYCGKGLSGGMLIVRPPSNSLFLDRTDENVIVGNACLYGATDGRAYFAGMAAERFAVRNSGAVTVVEGVGDHGCEYMTRGVVVVLGKTGINFAAGMSGGVAYILDVDAEKVNSQMVILEPVNDPKEIASLRGLISEHFKYTKSLIAERILANFSKNAKRFTKVIPSDVRRVLREAILDYIKSGGSSDSAAILDDWETMTQRQHERAVAPTLPGFLTSTTDNAINGGDATVMAGQSETFIGVSRSGYESRRRQLARVSIYADIPENLHLASPVTQYVNELHRQGRVKDPLVDKDGREFLNLTRMYREAYYLWRTGHSGWLTATDRKLVKSCLPERLSPAGRQALVKHMISEKKALDFKMAVAKGKDVSLLSAVNGGRHAADEDDQLAGQKGLTDFVNLSKFPKTAQVAAPTPRSRSVASLSTAAGTEASPVAPGVSLPNAAPQSSPPVHPTPPHVPSPQTSIIPAATTGPRPFLVPHQPDKLRGFHIYARQKHPIRSPSTRVMDWSEISVSLNARSRLHENLLRTQTARCMDCGTPTCHFPNSKGGGCPLGNRIPTWNALVNGGNWKRAAERLLDTNNFPEITGRVCPAPCEDSCVLGINEDPVTIKSIEHAISDEAWAKGWMKPKPPLTRTGRHVAVVGSGPAGLAAAQQLNRVGHRVTVFEKNDRIGGLMVYGIPNMKLDKVKVLQRRIALLEEEGIILRPGVAIGQDRTLEDLTENFDAVLLALGAEAPRDYPIPGRGLRGIHQGMELLHGSQKSFLDSDMTDGKFIDAGGKHVVIIGGGDTAVDCLATSIRMGAASVVQFSRRPVAAVRRDPVTNPWPQRAEVFKVDYGHEEAVSVQGSDPREYCVKALEFVPSAKDSAAVGGVKAIRVKTTKDPTTGVAVSVQSLRGTERVYPADLVFLAMGFEGADVAGVTEGSNESARAKLLEGDSTRRTDPERVGNIQVTEAFKTRIAKVFACGDCKLGATLIVTAIAEGRNAARAIDAHLMQGVAATPSLAKVALSSPELIGLEMRALPASVCTPGTAGQIASPLVGGW